MRYNEKKFIPRTLPSPESGGQSWEEVHTLLLLCLYLPALEARSPHLKNLFPALYFSFLRRNNWRTMLPRRGAGGCARPHSLGGCLPCGMWARELPLADGKTEASFLAGRGNLMANGCAEPRPRRGLGSGWGWKTTSCGGMDAGIHGATGRGEQWQPVFFSSLCCQF